MDGEKKDKKMSPEKVARRQLQEDIKMSVFLYKIQNKEINTLKGLFASTLKWNGEILFYHHNNQGLL